MSRPNKHIDSELLAQELKYLAGNDFSTEELELLLKSDLELDALEGFIAMRKAGINSDKALVDLQHELNQKLKGRRRPELPWHKLSIAATIAAVVGIGAFYIIKKEANEQKVTASKTIPETWTSGDTLFIYMPKDEALKVPQIAMNEPKSGSATSNQLVVPETNLSENAKEIHPIAALAVGSETVYDIAAQQAKRNALVVADKAPIQQGIKIKVIDILTGTPVENVALTIEGTKLEEADINGWATIAFDQIGKTLTIEKNGYASLHFKVEKSDKPYTLGLLPDIKAQAQKTVTAFLNNPKANAEAGLAVTSTAYRIYINKNIAYPKAFTEMGKEGTVELEFTVNPDGSLTDFKVIRSMGLDFDQPSIAVLRNGPKWLPAIKNGKPTVSRARYPVNFIQL